VLAWILADHYEGDWSSPLIASVPFVLDSQGRHHPLDLCRMVAACASFYSLHHRERVVRNTFHILLQMLPNITFAEADVYLAQRTLDASLKLLSEEQRGRVQELFRSRVAMNTL